MTVQGELLETSFQAVVLHGEAFVTAFYERLFTRFPQTRAFFAATDMLEQRKKLQQSLALIVQHMQHPEVLGGMLQELGQRHVTYGIRPEHYPLVGASERSCWRPSRTFSGSTGRRRTMTPGSKGMRQSAA